MENAARAVRTVRGRRPPFRPGSPLWNRTLMFNFLYVPKSRTSPKGQGVSFCLGLGPSAVSYSQPPSVGGQPPSAVVAVPFQLGPWWTLLYRTSFFLGLLKRNPSHDA